MTVQIDDMVGQIDDMVGQIDDTAGQARCAARKTLRESGTATVEFVWLAIILLIPVVYMLIAVFDVQRAAYGVSAASKAAARAFVLSPDLPTAHGRAQRAANVALADLGLPPTDIKIVCLPRPDSCLTTGSSVRVLVRVEQPLPLTPTALGDQIAAVTVDSTHVEAFGTYRADTR